MDSLTSGLEDYIEAIYIAYLNNESLKGAELARKMQISRASVSEALSKLVSKELILYTSYESITLTAKGISEAKNVYEKHHVLKDFFEVVLDIHSNEASENACKIEHIISHNILKKMTKLTKILKTDKALAERIKKEISK